LGELMEMGEDLIRVYFECLLEDEKEIPEPSNLQGDNILYIEVPADIEIPIMIKKYRKELNLTQSEVAKKINTPYQTIQKLEKIGSNPTIKTLYKIARAMGKKLIIDMV